MNYTVSELAESARRDIRVLARSVGTLKETYQLLADISGLSLSWVEKFHHRAKDNPRADTLDRLMEAIRVLQKKKAA